MFNWSSTLPDTDVTRVSVSRKVNEQPGLHHKMGAWTRCTGRALASSCGRTQHIGRQVNDSDRRTFEVMTLDL
jgi:hypothetical protein